MFYSSSSLNLALLPAGGAAHHPAALLPLDAALEAHVLVEDEPPDGHDPALVPGQGVVEVGGDAVDLVQAGPGDGGEVVVLVVQADVVGEPVEGAVVGEGFGDWDVVVRVLLLGGDGLVHVVLGDEVAGEGVQAPGEEGREEQVEDGLGGGEVGEGGVEGELDGDVEEVDRGEGDAVDGHGAEGVEEDLEGAEEGLAEDGVEDESLEGGGQVRVQAVDAEALVVGEVVGAERGAVGDADGQVGDDGEEAVVQGFPEGEVVGDFVDGEEEVLVGRGAEDVGHQPELPGEEGLIAEEVG